MGCLQAKNGQICSRFGFLLNLCYFKDCGFLDLQEGEPVKASIITLLRLTVTFGKKGKKRNTVVVGGANSMPLPLKASFKSIGIE